MHNGMKVLCIADHIDPVIYSANLKARFADVDLVLSAGDLALEYYDFIVSTLNKPLLFVFGNHHLEGRPSTGTTPSRRRRHGRKGSGRRTWRGRSRG